MEMVETGREMNGKTWKMTPTQYIEDLLDGVFLHSSSVLIWP